MLNRPTTPGKSSDLRLGRVSESYGCYFVTKVVHHRRSVFTNTEKVNVVTDSLSYLRQADRLKLFSFCVMPNHLHLAFCIMPGEELSHIIRDFSKYTARRLNQILGNTGPFWQEGFYDRHCRNRNELFELCEYIEHNPVRSSFVESTELWPHSSASPTHRGLLDRQWWP